MPWIITGVAILLSLPVGAALLLAGLYVYLYRNYLHNLARIFVEKPNALRRRLDAMWTVGR